MVNVIYRVTDRNKIFEGIEIEAKEEITFVLERLGHKFEWVDPGYGTKLKLLVRIKD